jgi:Cdc6-like AAA superfamily ATPase
VYLREKEIHLLKDFLSSAENILHISGNPGTGKTCTALYVVQSMDFEYFNYLRSNRIYKDILKTKASVILIDEFDKFFREDKKACMSTVTTIKRKGKKLITLSNTLNLVENMVHFKPYTVKEIEYIVVRKMEDDFGVDMEKDPAISIISRKFSALGDVRKAFEYCSNMFRSRRATSTCDKEWIGLNMLNENNKENVEINGNMHHEIIKEIAKAGAGLGKDGIYEVYLKRCKEIGLPFCNRSDFKIIYEGIN